MGHGATRIVLPHLPKRVCGRCVGERVQQGYRPIEFSLNRRPAGHAKGHVTEHLRRLVKVAFLRFRSAKQDQQNDDQPFQTYRPGRSTILWRVYSLARHLSIVQLRMTPGAIILQLNPHFMRIRRTLPVLLAVAIVGAAVAVAVQLRKHAPPEAARLLPGAEAFFYADIGWLRKVSASPLPTVPHDPEFERFIQQTGFEFERDLESAAFAVHYPASWAGGGSGGAAPEPRFSEVLIGKFNGEHLTGFLKQTAKSVENYNSVDIYTIPIEDRTLRVALLNVDSVAASNHDDPAVIRGMVDRSRRLASPFGGPALLRRYYKHVQLASPVWLVARVEPSAPEFSSWSWLFPQSADLVVSASYNPLHFPLRAGALHLRAEAWSGTNELAHETTEKVSAFLANFHTAEASVGPSGNDADLKALFESIEIRQDGTRAVLSATFPTSLHHKLVESQAPPADPRPASVQR